MRLVLALALLTAGMAFADEIERTTRSVTNGDHVIDLETFTRNGSTNLIRETKVQDGLTVGRVQRIRYGGQQAVGILWLTNSCTVLVETGLSFRVDTTFGPDGNLGSVMLSTEDGELLDWFNATNGLLYPVKRYEIKQFNKASRLVNEIVDTSTNTPAKK
jgi:hypothetical protein